MTQAAVRNRKLSKEIRIKAAFVKKQRFGQAERGKSQRCDPANKKNQTFTTKNQKPSFPTKNPLKKQL